MMLWKKTVPKKWLPVLLWLPLFLNLFVSTAWAEDNPPAFKEIQSADLPALAVDPEKFIFDLLKPAPTPQPEEITLLASDSRSWTSSEYRTIIAQVAKRYQLDPQLIYATIMTESNGHQYAFRYEAQLKDASFGLGQLLSSTAYRLGFHGSLKDLYDPAVNIDLIGRYHREILKSYGDLSPAQLAVAYNAGSPWKQAVPGHIYRFLHWYWDLNS